MLNNSEAVMKHYPIFPSRSKEGFPEFKSKIRVCVLLHNKAAFSVFRGKSPPSSVVSTDDTATLKAVTERTWKQAKQVFWSFLFRTSSGSTDNVVKIFEGKRPADGEGNEERAWKALINK